MKLISLSNTELLDALRGTVGDGHRVLARLLAYLVEVEERRLHLELACSSMYDFCVRKLGLGEDEAVRRIAVARLARSFPLILKRLETGALSMTALLLLRPHLTADNHDELLRAAEGKTKRAIEELLAARFPRPDVPSVI